MIIKKNIAIVTGGDSEEYSISIKSAQNVFNNLNQELFVPYLIELKNKKWQLLNHNNSSIDKNTFTLNIEQKNIKIDIIFMALHGSPAENGEIQSFFDNLKIPYTCCNSEVSELTFNKFKCNKLLERKGYNIAKSILHNNDNNIDLNDIFSKLTLPLFVKPNQAGSSNGISKIKKKDALLKAVKLASIHDKNIIIEEEIKGVEISCGVIRIKNNIHALEITEIISNNEFFDYDAKYNNESNEITPARITKKSTELVKNISKKIYEDLKLKGICRIDYILSEDKPYIIEINTIPGFSEKSIIPQQVIASGYNLKDFFSFCLEI